jgi:hypothetical protein
MTPEGPVTGHAPLHPKLVNELIGVNAQFNLAWKMCPRRY